MKMPAVAEAVCARWSCSVCRGVLSAFARIVALNRGRGSSPDRWTQPATLDVHRTAAGAPIPFTNVAVDSAVPEADLRDRCNARPALVDERRRSRCW